MKKIILIISAIAFFITFLVFVANKQDSDNSQTQPNNVSITGNNQTITITAKGGYNPRTTNAKANLATKLKIQTSGTFDCSSSLVIPSLRYKTHLPPSGETVIEIPAQKPGSTIRGLCSMGMFNFTLNFN